MRQIHGVKTTLLSRLLIVISFLSMVASAVGAQTPVPAQQTSDEKKPNSKVEKSDETADEKEIREKLKRLEETVNELKGQLDSLQAAKNNPKPAITDAVYSPSAAAVSGTTQPVSKPDPDPNDAGAKAAKAPNSTFEVYGFAMLDAGYQFRQNHPDWFDVIRPTRLPAFRDEFAPDGKTYWGVRQSRLGVKSSTPTKWGDLKTIFEFELFGTGVDAGQTTFRLRHAYGELGQFGAGQYWTVFGDVDAFPNTFEYWGPNGLVWFRNVQFRWMPLKGKNSVTIAVERPGASGDQGVYADRIELDGIRPKLNFPDLTGNARFERGWGHVQVSGILRSIGWEDINTEDQFDFSGHALGMGVSLSSNLKLGTNDVIRLQGTYGKGIQNYMNDAPVDVGIKITDNPNEPIEGVAIPMFAMSAFIDHKWNKKFASAFGYSMLNMENTSGQAADAFRRGQYGIGNLVWYPHEKVTVVGELQWGRRDNFRDGFSSEDVRIQFGFKYNFSKVFEL